MKPLHPNNQRLVDELEALSELEGRYTGLKLVNNPGGVKRGHFSLVFKAYDKVVGSHVAIKFFDLDNTKQDVFRLSCFDREHELLSKLIGVARCLQVASPISFYTLQLGSTAAPFEYHAKYFVTEWCEFDIDDYFLRQDSEKALVKLRLFNEVVMSVEALHFRSISHRDIKVDNFRGRGQKKISEVIAIDLGTAAAASSPPIAPVYSVPVGHQHYAAPETFCGFSGDRQLGKLADIYSLGCMLFELFAEDDFWTAYNDLNPDFSQRMMALMSAMAPYVGDDAKLLEQWSLHAARLFPGLSKLEFGRDGASVPLAIVDIINDLLARMTSPDFRFRKISLETVRRRLWSAIRCLENEAVAQKRAEKVARERASRREKARKRGGRALLKSLQSCGGWNGSA